MGCCWKDPNANTVIVFNPAKSTCQYLSDMLRRLCLCQIFWLRIDSLDSSTSTDRPESIWEWRAQFVLQLSGLGAHGMRGGCGDPCCRAWR